MGMLDDRMYRGNMRKRENQYKQYRRIFASIGGYARAGALSPEMRSRISSYASQTRWAKEKLVRENSPKGVSKKKVLPKADIPKVSVPLAMTPIESKLDKKLDALSAREQLDAQKKRALEDQLLRGLE